MTGRQRRRPRWRAMVLVGTALGMLVLSTGAGAVGQSPQPTALGSIAPLPSIVPVAPVAVAPVAPLAQPRQRHTATVLADGTVLFTGGWARDVGDLRSVERYDPRTGAVSAAGDLLRARPYHTATALPDGSVLVVGGTTDDVAELSSAELVTPPADPSAPVTVTAVGDMAFGRAHHVAVPVMGDGHVLILGGVTADGPVPNAELYDPVTRTFSPVMSLLGTLRGATAVRLGHAADAKVLVSDGAIRAQWLYDPATGTATSAASLPAARDGQAAVMLPDGRVLLIGGTDSESTETLGTTLIWDPTEDIVSAGPDLATGPRTGATAAVLPDGRIYIVGGTGPDGEWLATAELYDPATGTLTPAIAVRGERGDSTVSGLGSGDVVVAGGTDGRQTLAALDLLRPSASADPMPVATTVVMRVKARCDQARVLTGRGDHGLPVIGSSGTLDTTRVRTLRPGDRLTVDVAPSAGASYDSSCTGAADYRWYRVRAVNGTTLRGWVTAQVLVGGTEAFPAHPPMLDWADPIRIARVAFDDVTVDEQGIVHGVTATDTGLVYTTDEGGHWTSASVTHHPDKDVTSRPLYEGQPSISAADGLVVIAYEIRRADPIGSGDCAPGPCWEGHGVAVATLRQGRWSTKQVARSGYLPDVVTRGRRTYLVMNDAAVITYLTNASGSWRTAAVPRVSDYENVPLLAVDSHGRPHIAVGQPRSPSTISYAHRQAGAWKVQVVARPSALLSGIVVGPDDAVHIGYTRVRDLYPDDLCLAACDRPVGFHVRTFRGGRSTDQSVPGNGFGVFDVDARGPSVLSSDAQLAWRSLRSQTWLTRSWKRVWKGTVGTLLEPVRNQWIDVRGDSTYLFYRSVDNATWMIEGTRPAGRARR